MHPLLSQPSHQGVSTGKPSLAQPRPEQADHALALGLERTKPDRDETLASFQHFFEGHKATPARDQTPAVRLEQAAPEDEAALEKTPPVEADGMPANADETEIPKGDADPLPAQTGSPDLKKTNPAYAVSRSGAGGTFPINTANRTAAPPHFGWINSVQNAAQSVEATGADPGKTLPLPSDRATTHSATAASALALLAPRLAQGRVADQTVPAIGPASSPALTLLDGTQLPTAPATPIAGADIGKHPVLPPQAQIPPETPGNLQRKGARTAPSEASMPAPITHAKTAPNLLASTPMAAAVLQQASDQARGLNLLSTDALTQFTTDVANASSSQPGTLPTRADLPVHIARQLIDVAQHLPSRPVDITLSPDELGRVRLSVIPSETGIVVNVLAERPETLDLMRRHIDQLAQEFQSLGYDNISFSFSGSETDTSPEKDGQTADSQMPDTARDPHNDGADNATIHLSNGPTTGLDLRL